MDILPYCVKYKAGSDKTILPGIHGRYETRQEAQVGMDRCAKFFGGGKQTPEGFIVGKAIIGIVVDQAALRKQQEQEKANMEGFGSVEAPEEEMDETEILRAENARLRAALGEEDESPSAKKMAKV